MENLNNLNNSTESKDSSLTKVFLVFFDNELSYEDRNFSLRKIYFSEEKAKQFVEEKNAELQKEFIPPTREEFALMDIEDTYEGYVDYLGYEYSLHSSGKYFYYEYEAE